MRGKLVRPFARAFHPDLEPTTLTTTSGHLIPYPKGSASLIRSPVKWWGEKCLDVLYPPWLTHHRGLNIAQDQYRKLRQANPALRGWWVAVAENGSFVATATQAQTSAYAERLFSPQQLQYYFDCMHLEVAQEVMLDYPVPADSVPDVVVEDLKGKNSALLGSHLFVRGELSFDGKEYEEVAWKYDTGASMVGVPAEVLASPPQGVVLTRQGSVLVGSSKLNAYEGLYVRVGGLVTRTTVVEARSFLLGFPVYSRFRALLDARAGEVVALTPLQGETSHLPVEESG